MAERSYWRDLTYSLFHRPASARRFIDGRMADILCMCDIDSMEYCYACSRPVALIETKAGKWRPVSVTPLLRLAELANVPAFVVFYARGYVLDPIYTDRTNLNGDPIYKIVEFQIVRAAEPNGKVWHMTPKQYFRWLSGLHLSCPCPTMSNIRKQREQQKTP